MANEQSGIKFFVILTLFCLTSKTCLARGDEESDGAGPLLEAVQQLLQESQGKNSGSGLNVIGGLLQGFMQAGGGKQLGGGFGRKSSTLSLISGLGTLFNSMKDQNKEGKSGGEQGGFDPSVLGTVVDLISTLSQAQAGSVDDNRIDSGGSKSKKQKEPESSVDWSTVLEFAGSLLSNANSGQSRGSEGGGSGSGLESILSFLPVLMSSMSGRHHPHSSSNVPHHTHPTFLPPFLENLHEYWDHFTSSQFGRTLWENSGLASLIAQFQDENGTFMSERVFESLENNSQRRRWIKGISSFVAEWAHHISNTDTQVKYMETVQALTNSFLQSEGYPKKTHLNLKKPGESISSLVDEVFSRQLGLKVNSGTYIKPAISYFQEILSVTQKRGLLAGLTASSIESKLSSTLDEDLIEPVLRANRAYRFALRDQSCTRYVLCVINKSGDPDSKATLKPAVVKISSMTAAWFLSTPTQTSFFELYGASADSSCNSYDRNCADFHEEDSRATTEYFHNEL